MATKTKKYRLRKFKKIRLTKLGKLVFGGAFAACIGLAGLIQLPGYLTKKELMELGYTEEAVEIIKEQKLTSKIKKNAAFSPLLEKVIVNDQYQEEYFNYYLGLSTFTSEEMALIEKLAKKNYTEAEIIELYKAFEAQELYKLLVFDKLDDISDFIEKNGQVSNTDLLNPYENMAQVTVWETNMLVNKKRQITDAVIIENLREVKKDCAFKTTILNDEAATAFESMCMAAKEEGVYFASVYGYRSYADQKEIYDEYVETKGVEEANSLAAYPGSSEHQLGLAVDVASMVKASTTKFVDTAEYLWLQENAWKYGFIERYHEGDECITGYDAEPWHWRYVGTDLAQKVRNSGMTYDEYYMAFIN